MARQPLIANVGHLNEKPVDQSQLIAIIFDLNEDSNSNSVKINGTVWNN